MLHVVMVVAVHTIAVSTCHDDTEGIAAQMQVEITLIRIVCRQIEKQLLSLVLLCWDEGCRHGGRNELMHDAAIGAPFGSVWHREHPHTP